MLSSYDINRANDQLISGVNILESRLVEIEKEISSMHKYLDQMGISTYGVTGKLTVAERLEELAKKTDIIFTPQK